MTYAFIAERCSDLAVATCCRVMKVSTSGFYAWRAEPYNARTGLMHQATGACRRWAPDWYEPIFVHL